MAPASNSAKALQQNRPRPAVPRTVVPAIPLPYIQKRQQQDAARAKAKEQAAVPTTVETPEPSSPCSTTAHISPAIANGSSERSTAEKPEEHIESASPMTPATPATPALEESSQQSELGENEVSIQDMTTGKQTEFTPPCPFALTSRQKNPKRRRDRFLQKRNPQHRGRLTRCLHPSSLRTTVSSTAWLLIPPNTPRRRHSRRSTASLRCTTPIPVLEASCLAVTLTRTILLLHLPHPLAMSRRIHTNKHLSMELPVTALISPMARTLRTCPMASLPWARRRRQDTIRVQMAS
jgi:hypothetical protein